jgi:nitrous oxide reductase accessory protein NosL
MSSGLPLTQARLAWRFPLRNGGKVVGWRLHYFALEIGGARTVLHAFACAVDAEEGARIIARLADGVVAFQQWGNPETAEWEAPDPLLVIGCVPDGSLGEPAEVPRAA